MFLFIIFALKYILGLLIGIVSAGRFYWILTRYILVQKIKRKKENILDNCDHYNVCLSGVKNQRYNAPITAVVAVTSP